MNRLFPKVQIETDSLKISQRWRFFNRKASVWMNRCIPYIQLQPQIVSDNFWKCLVSSGTSRVLAQFDLNNPG